MGLEQNFKTNKLAMKTLTTVTPLSRYLVMILFITLPFVGGWIGYVLAVGIVNDAVLKNEVIIEPVVVKGLEDTAKVVTKEDVESEIFIDEDLGISFFYPKLWGEIRVDDEIRDICKNEEINCGFRVVSLGNEVILSAAGTGEVIKYSRAFGPGWPITSSL